METTTTTTTTTTSTSSSASDSRRKRRYINISGDDMARMFELHTPPSL